MTGTVAVVIPVYNRAELVVRALDSVAAQTRLPAQLIVVDNNSADISFQVVAEWFENHPLPGVDCRLLSEMKPGAAAARNAGVNETLADYVVFLDSDDMILPNLIEEMTIAIEQNDYPDLLLWWSDIMHDGKRVSRRPHHKDLYKAQIYQARICTQNFGCRTDFFRSIGAWNESLLCWDDWELGIRLLCAKPRIVVIDKPLMLIFPQAVSITGENHYSKAGEWEKAIDEAERILSSHPYGGKLTAMVNYRRLNLAALYKHEGKPDLADTLKASALSHLTVTPLLRIWMKMIYTLTSRGVRGGYLLFDCMMH